MKHAPEFEPEVLNTFLDGLALLMSNEVEWAKFTTMLALRCKRLKDKPE